MRYVSCAFWSPNRGCLLKYYQDDKGRYWLAANRWGIGRTRVLARDVANLPPNYQRS